MEECSMRNIGEAWKTLAQEINSHYLGELPLTDRLFYQKIIQPARDVVRQQRVENTTGSNQTSGDFEEACLSIVAELNAKSPDEGKLTEVAASELQRQRNGQALAAASVLFGGKRRVTTEEASSSTEEVILDDNTEMPCGKEKVETPTLKNFDSANLQELMN
ncbi:hypothetical protein EDC96DRAFT_549927 [Choanephora cucurbitarum]|nr:hypothetical protein EDC96DRAFT_549927 [Choanephora cucurbitarum]